MRAAFITCCLLTLLGAAPPRIGQATHYVGTVRTIRINNQAGGNTLFGAIAYDTKRDCFYMPFGVGILKISKTGATSPFAVLPSAPTSITYNPVDDKLYYTDSFHYAVFSVDQHGLVLLVSGGSQGTLDGRGTAAQFQLPQGITADPDNGDLYVADIDRVRRVTRGGLVKTISPPGGFGSEFSGFPQTPEGITYNPLNRTFFVTDAYQQKIWHIVAGAVKYVSGQCINFCQPYQRDGPLSFALFGSPNGAVFDPATGSLYIADTANNQVRAVNPKGVSTLAGGGAAGNVDGVGSNALFSSPSQAVLDTKTGEIVLFDYGNDELRVVTPAGPAPPPPAHSITMYDPPTEGSAPASLAIGPDGSVWFTEPANKNAIGRRMPNGTFIEYPGPPSAFGIGRIILGGDGNMWVAAIANSCEIDRIAPDGTITEFPVTQISRSVPVDMVLGSDGNIWFGDQFDGVGYMTPAGVVTFFSGITGNFIADGLAATYWLSLNGSVAQIDSSGHILRKISLPLQPGNMVLGPDGDEWLAQPGALARITAHSLVEFVIPLSRNPGDLTVGADGRIWFWENAGAIARMSTGGSFAEFAVPAPRSSPSAIAAAADGSIWFADPGSQKIGRYH